MIEHLNIHTSILEFFVDTGIYKEFKFFFSKNLYELEQLLFENKEIFNLLLDRKYLRIFLLLFK